MTALHQTRLVVAIGVVAALCAVGAALLGRAIDPAAPTEGTAVHVVWALTAGLAQLLAQCWMALFGWGTLRLLARCGRRAPRWQRLVLLAAPLGVVALIAVAVWIGIQAYAAGRSSPLHFAIGWTAVAGSLLAVLVEWRTLEVVERAVAAADVDGGGLWPPEDGRSHAPP